MLTKKMKVTGRALAITAVALTGASACMSSASLQPGGPTTTPSAPAPKTASDAAVLLSAHGTGKSVTPKFTSHSGNYIVSWSYSGNSDQFGPTNFSITEDGGSDYNSISLPNDIAASGHGSTSVTNDPGTHNFNIDAGAGATWTIKVESE